MTPRARAEARFAAGDLTGARAILIDPAAATDGRARHLLGIVHRRLGEHDAAEAAFTDAARLLPGDAAVANDWGNARLARGDAAGARACFESALALDPAHRDARLGLGLAAHRAGDLDAAIAALGAATRARDGDARAWTALGLALRDAERWDAAEAALDRALALEPARANALHARARIALERGDPDAVPRYTRALAAAPADPAAALGLAQARLRAGDAGGLGAMRDLVRRHPEWLDGHEAFTQAEAEAGEADPGASYRAAIALRSRDPALWRARLGVLARARRYAELLAEAADARAAIGDDPVIALLAASAASEAGDPRADTAFAALLATAATGDVTRAAARHRLRARDPVGAAALLEPIVVHADGPANDALGWALLATAWRLTGDARHDWLCAPPLWGARDLDIPPVELAELAVTLRALHVARAQPFDQTLRGGTQTRGRLFAARAPAITRLRARLDAAVAAHVAALPPTDPTHPLLAAPRAHRIAGSWSVRLAGGGAHVNHVHPQGWLSSACYVALPGRTAADNGVLTLGQPPAELGLDLPPLATIEPRPGRLALFPAYLWHGTRPTIAGERLTVAFDVVRTKTPGV